MAVIAFDAASSSYGIGGASYNHTVTGSDTVLVVSVVRFTTQTLSGVAFNGDALTQVGTELALATGTHWMSLWIKINPTTGTHPIAITGSGALNWAAAGASYTGCSGTQPDASVSAKDDASGTTFTNVVTSTVDNCWHVSGFTGGLISAGASTVERADTTSNDGNHVGFYDGNAAITPAGSNTLNFATSPSGGRASFGCTLSPKLVIDQICLDTLSITDAVSKLTSRAITDSVSTTDTASAIHIFPITITDVITVADTIAKTTGKVIIDTITTTTNVLKTAARTIVDTITTTTAVSTLIIFVREIVDIITTTDVVSRVGTFIRAIVDTITVITVATVKSLWTKRTKPSSSWTDRTKPTSIWTDRTPPTTPWS